MGHGHDHGNPRGARLGVSILLNILITGAQAVGGFFAGSLSLLSDALHNLSDVIALVISYIAEKLSRGRYTPERTFGYKRAEVIAAFVNAATLIAVAMYLAWEAIARFNEPREIQTLLVIALAGASILVNGGSVLLLKKDAQDSMNIKSAYLHLFSDMITSVAVLLGGLAMYFYGIYWLDGVLTLLIAAYLAYSSLSLLSETLSVLMQFTPRGMKLEEIKTAVEELPFVENVHHMHAWQLKDGETHFNAHLDFKNDLKLSSISAKTALVRKLLHDRFRIEHTVLQAEYGVADAKGMVPEHC